MKSAFRFLSFLCAIWFLAACANNIFQITQSAPGEIDQAASTPTPTPTPYYYIVKPGDTLWTISQKVGVDIEVLIQVNELSNPDVIQPGDRLLISKKVTISGKPLPTPTPTPIPCMQGCIQPPEGCVVKGFRARLDGMKLYVLPEDAIYPVQRGETWFCREEDAIAAGFVRWTPSGPKIP
ncbi:MAG TPA: LysM peptidoglycan-binding domain-containing protein [Anaerolineae bacterium]|nr:LysM peptidoglycan-binding domain-containing protein [Anaerolineae bacterium]